MQPISIPLSKTKILLLLAGAILFVVGGCWMLVKAPTVSNPVLSNIYVVRTVGVAAVLFFGLCAVYAARKLFSTRPGFVIDDFGITDNSGGISVGAIPWSDMLNITIMMAQRQKFIMIHVKNPEDYINKQTSFIKRKMMQMNHKAYGSPLALSANSLRTSFGELFNLLRDQFEKRNKPQ
ncbi:hypothetical protein D3H65_09865 [Paraflavitalea soli]|uniref:Uncharacterized protein n=1 Tax=Paraflavitalea soli TaxID=2315862 RepID=A0A3B7MUY6_9BACT|nr:STM3941 family protein [Paraflavitalea soli]AXY74261.1 hypothetical protein D3H65_09865 [Paraflavitalea soli]